jgi:hypothetical protein
MHNLKNIIAQAGMIGRYFADKGQSDKVRKQFALVRSVADLETDNEETPCQEMCYAAIDAQEEALVHMANKNVAVCEDALDA